MIRPLRIPGAWEFKPVVHTDDRGLFLEFARPDLVAETLGFQSKIGQVSVSTSRQAVIRGIHATRRPSGQEKYIMCLAGEVLDIVVDLRPETDTFGLWDVTFLSEERHNFLYLREGLGHGFQVLTPAATIVYATSTTYDPEREYAVNPMDPSLALPWELQGHPIASGRDLAAPTIDEWLSRSDCPFLINPVDPT